MKVIAFLAVLLIAGQCATLHQTLMRDLFAQWKLTHKKGYSAGMEEELRFHIFQKNYLSILEFNQAQDDVTLALNHFADLTTEEFGAMYTGYNPQAKRDAPTAVFNAKDLPTSVDWRTQGAVTAVKNQGSCGSCWAFSTTGSLEGFYFINNKNLVAFSEQQLVDCDRDTDQGCNGGLMADALTYTAANGIESETDYPYKGVDGKCAYDSSKAYKVNKGYANVTVANVTAMKAALVNQPVSVAIQANQLVFQFYAGGVIKKFCGDNLDHGVLAVGYDVIKGEEAFIVKNSWGGSWGNSGYVYISTDGTANKGNGVCGILADACVPN
jgi:C1A family cysteine protease